MTGVFQYYDATVRGTKREDSLVILQFMKEMIGQGFSFLNYYKEIPVSYNATLLSVENEMAEFDVHDYQAKIIAMDKSTLIYSHPLSDNSDDMIGEAFYVNTARKRVILCNFGYVRIRSDMRQFVRVHLDNPVDADLIFAGDLLEGAVQDISLGGAAISTMSADLLVPGLDIHLLVKLPDPVGNSRREVGLRATIINVIGSCAPYTCFLEFHPEKHSQQHIGYYINHRQVEIIKELKDING